MKLSIVLLSLLALPASATSSRIAPADFQADLDLLERALETLHPGVDRYETRAQLAVDFAETKKRFRDGPTLGQAYLALSELTAHIKCGHTFVNPANQSKSVLAALFQTGGRLPFYFRWLDGHMVVTRSFGPSAGAFPAGAEVLSVDGVPAATLLAKMMPLVRSDGSNDAKRVSLLEVTGDSKYEPFDVFLPLLVPTPSATRAVRVRAPGGSAKDVKVKLLSFDERIAPILEREKSRQGGDGPQATFELVRPDVAVLTMPTWALFNSKWNWHGFLEKSVATLASKKIGTLIVDLRGNEGGEDVGDVLLGHLVTHKVPRERFSRKVRYRQVPAELAPFLDTWDPSFKDWGKDAVGPDAAGFYALTKWDDGPEGTVLVPLSPHYDGKVFVLVDSSNSSATFQFADIVQEQKLGTLIGEPTGGNLRGINGGAFFFMRLPHTGLEVDIPLVGRFPPTPQPDAGLQPDIRARPTAADIAAKRDVALAAALKAAGH